jgi:hypothetical protein
MRNIITFFSIFILFLVVGAILLTSKLATSDIKKAARYAAVGNCEKAISGYGQAAIAMADARKLPYVPDKAQAMNLNPQTWQNPLADFVDWAISIKKFPENLSSTLALMDACTTSVSRENSLYAITYTKASLEQFTAAWKNALCPEKMQNDTMSYPIIEKAFSSGLCLVTVSGNSIYSYELNLICRESGKLTIVGVDCDKQVTFPLKQGTYAAIVSGKKMFEGGRVWVSQKESIPFMVPDSATVLTACLKTEVKRGK